MTADGIVEKLGLAPIPNEGGWFKRVYTGPELDGRPRMTSIYALFTRTQFSALHRLDADEVFFFHSGDPFEMLELLPDGSGRRVVLGIDVSEGEVAQHCFRKGSWFGGIPSKKGTHGYSLMSCVVTPGFIYEGFELAEREELFKVYPEFYEVVIRLIR